MEDSGLKISREKTVCKTSNDVRCRDMGSAEEITIR